MREHDDPDGGPTDMTMINSTPTLRPLAIRNAERAQQDNPRALLDEERDWVDANRGLAGLIAGQAQRGRNRDDFDDTLQEACIGLCNGVIRFNPDHTSQVKASSYITWGARSAVKAHELARSRRKHRILSRAQPLDIDGDECYGESDPDRDDEIDNIDRRAALYEAIERLPELDREVIKSRLDGQSLTQIGARMRRSKERIRQLEDRGHRLLRVMLAAKGVA